MFFLSTYSLLAYFWAQLSLTLAGASSRMLRPLLLGGLGSLWLAFATVLLVLAIIPEHLTPAEAALADQGVTLPLRAPLLAFLGLAYAAVLSLVVYFGVRIAIPARRRKAIFGRTVILGATCSVALLLRSATCLSLASGERKVSQ